MLGPPSAATISKIDFDNARRALAHRQRQDKLQRQAQRLQQQQQQQQRLPEEEEKEKKARSTRSVGTQGELFMSQFLSYISLSLVVMAAS
jgi:uncharacterized membrane protein YdbT with pleckstrin-like domain